MGLLDQVVKAIVGGGGSNGGGVALSKCASIGGIWIDCTVRERHHFAAEVSDHPVETGSNVADHVRMQPEQLELECVVSNVPTREPESHADGAKKTTKKIKLPPQPAKLPLGLGTAAVRVGPFGELAIKDSRDATVMTFEPGFNRVETVFNELRTLMAAGEVLTVVTSLGDYDDMVITDLDVPRSSETVKSLRFTIGFRKIRSVTSKDGGVTDPKMERGKPSVSKGLRNAAAAGSAAGEAASAQDRESLAHSMAF